VLAARIHDWGGKPLLEEVPEPVPAPGETLVEVTAAAIGHIDLTVAAGRFAYRPSLPHVPGVEGAARVLDSPSLPSGAPVRIRGGGVGLERDGTWAERAAVATKALHPVPEGLDESLVATFFGPAVTARVAVDEIGRLEPGERVAVTGASGAVGSLAVQLARRAGAGSVVALVSRPEKAPLVPPGAEVVAGDLPEEPVDLLIDTCGGPRLATLLTRAVRPGGRAVLVGYTAGTQLSLDLPALLAADVTLHPVNLIRRGPRLAGTAAELLDLLVRGDLTLRVTTFPLSRVAEAVELVRSGAAAGRVALVPER
jgi:NADPH2:quinone reductase